MDCGLFVRGTRQTLLQWKPGPRVGLDPRADLGLSEGAVGPGQEAVTIKLFLSLRSCGK